ncbi:MAG: hypothetical protein KIT20_05030 [Alphaproteobacteria bacterium]|nr:hypothetical protein [Alphaproteobacteria bacterium]
MPQVFYTAEMPDLDKRQAALETRRAALRPRLAAVNINPVTFLATDYLNHFNEAVMLVEMLPDAPELIEELIAWRPKDYVGHFSAGSMAMREIARIAYELAPERYRIPFDFVTRVASRRLRRDIALLTGVAGGRLAHEANQTALAVRPLIALAAAIVNGREVEMHSGRIVEGTAATQACATMVQGEIDELFAPRD